MTNFPGISYVHCRYNSGQRKYGPTQKLLRKKVIKISEQKFNNPVC